VTAPSRALRLCPPGDPTGVDAAAGPADAGLGDGRAGLGQGDGLAGHRPGDGIAAAGVPEVLDAGQGGRG
jgi:hypothetical protein